MYPKLVSSRELAPVLTNHSAKTEDDQRALKYFILAEIDTDPTEAETLCQQAQEIVEYIADHTPAGLRTSFLNSPEVRAVLEG